MNSGTFLTPLKSNQAITDICTEAAFQIILAIADRGKDFSSRFPKIVVK